MADLKGGRRDLEVIAKALERARERFRGFLPGTLAEELYYCQVLVSHVLLWLRAYHKALERAGTDGADIAAEIKHLEVLSGKLLEHQKNRLGQ